MTEVVQGWGIGVDQSAYGLALALAAKENRVDAEAAYAALAAQVSGVVPSIQRIVSLTRSAFVAGLMVISATTAAGSKVQADDRWYMRVIGATVIPDLPGWVPAGRKVLSQYGADAAAILAMIADFGRVVFDKADFVISTSLTIAGPIRFDDGASIVAAPGVLVTIAGLIHAPKDQWIFKGEGNYTTAAIGTPGTVNGRNVWMHWWGVQSAATNDNDMAPRISKCTQNVGGTENIINVLHGRYPINSPVTAVPRGTDIRCAGKRRTVFSIYTDYTVYPNGYDVFTSGGDLCRISECNFEIPSGGLHRAGGAYVRWLHNECEIRHCRGGAADLNFVIAGNNCQVEDVSGFWGPSIAAVGSSLLLITGNNCMANGVQSPTTTAYAPAALVHIGGAAAPGAVNATSIRNVLTYSPGTSIYVESVNGPINSLQFTGLDDRITSGSVPPMIVLHAKNGHDIGVPRVDEWKCSAYHQSAIKAYADGGNIVALLVGQGRASGSSGAAIELVANSGRSVGDVLISPDADIWQRAGRVTKSGAGTFGNVVKFNPNINERLAEWGLQKQVNIASGAVYTMYFPGQIFSACLDFHTNNASTAKGRAYFRSVASAAECFIQAIADFNPGALATAAVDTDLTVSGGTAGKLTFSVHSTARKLQIHNGYGADLTALGLTLKQSSVQYEFAA